MNAPRPTAFSPTEILAWKRRTPLSRRRVTLRWALGSALVYGFGLFLVFVGIMHLIGGVN